MHVVPHKVIRKGSTRQEMTTHKHEHLQDLGRHTLLLLHAAPVPELYNARSRWMISCV